MTIVGFNFTKIVAEKSGHIKGKVDIKNNVKITKIETHDLAIGSAKESGIKFSYEFVSNYEPNIGMIQFKGDLLSLESKENAKKILDEWKKSKKIDPTLMTNLLNGILTKCNIKALVLSQDINLPPPIPLPKFQAGKKPTK